MRAGLWKAGVVQPPMSNPRCPRRCPAPRCSRPDAHQRRAEITCGIPAAEYPVITRTDIREYRFAFSGRAPGRKYTWCPTIHPRDDGRAPMCPSRAFPDPRPWKAPGGARETSWHTPVRPACVRRTPLPENQGPPSSNPRTALIVPVRQRCYRSSSRPPCYEMRTHIPALGISISPHVRLRSGVPSTNARTRPGPAPGSDQRKGQPPGSHSTRNARGLTTIRIGVSPLRGTQPRSSPSPPSATGRGPSTPNSTSRARKVRTPRLVTCVPR